jgi:Cadherin-like beta sandwich domain
LPSLGLIEKFDAKVTNYALDAPNAVDSVRVVVSPEHPEANPTVNSKGVEPDQASFEIPLVVGQNTIVVTITAEDGNTVTTYTIVITRAPSANAFLSLLASDPKSDLDGIFKRDVNTYSIKVVYGVASIAMIPTLEDKTATITVQDVAVNDQTPSRPIDLTVGSNTIVVVVTAEDRKTIVTYTVTIERLRSTNPFIADIITVPSIDLTFKAETHTYTVDVPNTVDNLQFKFLFQQSDAVASINEGTSLAHNVFSDKLSLVVDSNVFSIVTTAHDATTTSNYVLTIIRARSAIATLSNITTSPDIQLPFDAKTRAYSIQVRNIIEQVSLAAVLTDLTATLFVQETQVSSGALSGPYPLVVGDNLITIDVTAEDFVTKQNTVVKIERLRSDFSNLKRFITSNPETDLNDQFTTEVTDYTIFVPYETTSTLFIATPYFNLATMVFVQPNGVREEIAGNSLTPVDLSVYDNRVQVIVTAENQQNVTTYRCNMFRRPSVDASLKSLTLTPDTPLQFNPKTLDYTIEVGNLYAETILRASATSEEEEVFVTIDIDNQEEPITLGRNTDFKWPLHVDTNTATMVVYAQNNTVTQTYTLRVKRARSAVATLSRIFTAPFIGVEFDQKIRNYTFTLDNTVDRISVLSTLVDKTATLRLNGVVVNDDVFVGPIALDVGTNRVIIEVTAEDRTTVIVTEIQINRLPSAVSEAKSWLTSPVTSLNSQFQIVRYKYETSVVYEVPILTFVAEPLNEFATMTLIHANGTETPVRSGEAMPVALNVYENTVKLVLLAENRKDTHTYTIDVFRRPSTNPLLESLALTPSPASDIKFSQRTFLYEFDVENDFTSTVVVAVPDSKEPEVRMTVTVDSINTYNLTSGEKFDWQLHVDNNTIDIEVTAQDLITKQLYRVRIHRDRSRDAYIWNVTSEPEIPALKNFDPDVTEHTVSIPNSIDSIQFAAWPRHPAAVPVIDGTRLSHGKYAPSKHMFVWNNTIRILCEAEDCQIDPYLHCVTREYIFHVNRDPSIENRMAKMYTEPSSGLSGNFDRDKPTAIGTVLFEVKQIQLAGILVDSTATFTIASKQLAEKELSPSHDILVGENKFDVVVTAEDTVSKLNYTVTIVRLPSTNTALRRVDSNPSNVALGFKPDIFEYNAEVHYLDATLTLSIETDHDQATVTVNGVAVNFNQSIDVDLDVYANVVDVLVTAQNTRDKQLYRYNVYRKPSGNAQLASVTFRDVVSENVIDYGKFDPESKDHSVTVPNNVVKVTVSVTAFQPNVTVTLNNVYKLTLGEPSTPVAVLVNENVFRLRVLAMDRVNQVEYFFSVFREPSSVSTLESLSTFPATSLQFSKDNDGNDYSVSVSHNTKEIAFLALATASRAADIRIAGTFAVSGVLSQAIPLEVGQQDIPIVVTAEDRSTTTTYTITVTRLPNSNANIETIVLNPAAEEKLVVLADQYYYTTSVLHEVTDIQFNVTAQDAGASMYLYSYYSEEGSMQLTSGKYSRSISLASGRNEFYIDVTAQDKNSYQSYVLVVFRRLSPENRLSALTPPVSEKAFSSDAYQYTVDVPFAVSEVTFVPIPVSYGATVYVNGNLSWSGTHSGCSDQQNPEYPNPELPGPYPELSSAFSSSDSASTCSADSGDASCIVLNSRDDRADSASSNFELMTRCGPVANITVPLAVFANIINVVIVPQDVDASRAQYDVAVFRAPSSDARLKSLSTTPSTGIAEKFDTSVRSYSISLPNSVDELDITAVSFDAGAVITIDNLRATSGKPFTRSISVFNSRISINVVAQDFVSTQRYYINVYRAPSTDSKLTTTTFGDVTVDWRKLEVSETEIELVYEVESIAAIPVASHPAAVIVFDGKEVKSESAAATRSLVSGEWTQFIINVTAEDKETTTDYVVRAYRRKSWHSSLTSLESSVSNDGLKNFDAAQLEYRLVYPYEVSKLQFKAVSFDSDSTLTLNNTNQTMTSGVFSDAIDLPVNSEITVTIHVLARNEINSTEYTVRILRLQSANVQLATLRTVPESGLSSQFVSSQTSYDLRFTYTFDNVTFIPVFNHPDQVVTMSYETPNSPVSTPERISANEPTITIILPVGVTKFRFDIVAANGKDAGTYTITIDRLLSDNANLANIVTSPDVGLSSTFAADKLSYQVQVDFDVWQIRTTVFTQQADAYVTWTEGALDKLSNGDSFEQGLVLGVNTIPLNVVAMDRKTTQVYTLTVYRKQSSNAEADGLDTVPSPKGSPLSEIFNAETSDYTLNYVHDVSSIAVLVRLARNVSNVQVNDSPVANNELSQPLPLQVGENVISVEITAQDQQNVQVYTIRAVRDPSSDSRLFTMSSEPTTGLQTQFDRARHEYNLWVSFETLSIQFVPVVNERFATLQIFSDSFELTSTASGALTPSVPLGTGQNKVTVRVTAQDTVTTTDYVLNVERSPFTIEWIAPPKSTERATEAIISDAGPLALRALYNNVSAVTETEGFSVRVVLVRGNSVVSPEDAKFFLRGSTTGAISNAQVSFSDLVTNGIASDLILRAELLNANGQSTGVFRDSIVFSTVPGRLASISVTQAASGTRGGEVSDTPLAVQLWDSAGNAKTLTSGVQLDLAVSSFDTKSADSIQSYSYAYTPSTDVTGTTTITVSSGVASFSGIKFGRAGTYTVTVLNQVDKVEAPSIVRMTTTIDVAIGAPSQVIFEQAPPYKSSVRAGLPFPLSVVASIADRGGNVVPQSEVEIQPSIVLSLVDSNSNGGTLSGELATSTRGGRAVFGGLSIDRVGGGYALQAEAGSASELASAKSAPSFTVELGDPAALGIVQQPGNALGNAPLSVQPIVELLDTGGNRHVKSALNVQALLIADEYNSKRGTPQLGGSIQLDFIDGLATWNNLRVDQIGKYRLNFTTAFVNPEQSFASDSGVVSSQFAITFGAPSSLRVIMEPVGGNAGEPLAVQPSVAVVDAGGNVVEDDTSNITAFAYGSNGLIQLDGTVHMQLVEGTVQFTDLQQDAIGAFRITFVYQNNNSISLSTVSAPYQVTTGPAAALRWVQQPAKSVIGGLLLPPTEQPEIHIIDLGGNTLSYDNSSTIEIQLVVPQKPVASVPSGAVAAAKPELLGTTTLTVIGGVAKFTDTIVNGLIVDLRLRASGTIINRDQSARSVNLNPTLLSDEFTTTVGPPTRLEMISVPTGAFTGEALETVVLDLLDAGGNLVTTDDTSTASLIIETLAIDSLPVPTNNADDSYDSIEDLESVSQPHYMEDMGEELMSDVIASANSKACTFPQQASTTTSRLGRLSFSGAYMNCVGRYSLKTVATLVNLKNATIQTVSEPIPVQIGRITQVSFGAFITKSISIDIDDDKSRNLIKESESGPQESDSDSVFAQVPEFQAAQTWTSLAVALTDEFGNVNSSDETSVLRLSLKDLNSSMPRTPTLSGELSVQVYRGRALFSNLTVDRIGMYNLKGASIVYDRTGSQQYTVTGTSTDIKVVYGPPHSVAMQQEPVGSPINVRWPTQPRIALLDKGLNVLPFDYGSTIRTELYNGAGSSPASAGTLQGTVAPSPVSGVVQYTDLSVDTIGKYRIACTWEGVDTYTSASTSFSLQIMSQIIVVEPPVPTGLRFYPSPVGGRATLKWPSYPTVEILDSIGDRIVLDNVSTIEIDLEPIVDHLNEPALRIGGANGTLREPVFPKWVVSDGELQGRVSRRVVQGASTFSDLLLGRIGWYRLVARSSIPYPPAGYSAIVDDESDMVTARTISLVQRSEPFAIRLAPPDQLVFRQQPGAGNRDEPFVQPRVDLVDAGMNTHYADSNTTIKLELVQTDMKLTVEQQRIAVKTRALNVSLWWNPQHAIPRLDQGVASYKDLRINVAATGCRLRVTANVKQQDVPSRKRFLEVVSDEFKIIEPYSGIVVPEGVGNTTSTIATVSTAAGPGSTAVITGVTSFTGGGHGGPSIGVGAMFAYLVYIQTFVVTLQHNAALAPVAEVFSSQQMFQGNLNDDGDSDLYTYAHNFFTKMVSLFALLIFFRIFPGYYVETCCCSFTILASFFIPLFLILLTPLSESWLELTDLPEVAFLTAGTMLLLLFFFVRLRVKPQLDRNFENYSLMIPMGRGSESICLVADDEEDDAEDERGCCKDCTNWLNSMRVSVSGWRCRCRVHGKDKRIPERLAQVQGRQMYRKELEQRTFYGKKRSDWSKRLETADREWTAFYYRPMFDQVVRYRVPKNHTIELSLIEKLRISLALYWQWVRVAFILFVVAFAIGFEGETQLIFVLLTTLLYVAGVIIIVPLRNPFLQKEIAFMTFLAVQFALLLALLESPTDVYLIVAIAILQVAIIPVDICLTIRFREPPETYEEFVKIDRNKEGLSRSSSASSLSSLELSSFAVSDRDISIGEMSEPDTSVLSRSGSMMLSRMSRDTRVKHDGVHYMRIALGYWDSGEDYRYNKKYCYQNFSLALKAFGKQRSNEVALCLAYMGRIHQYHDDDDRAIKFFRASLKVNATNRVAGIALSEIYKSRGENDKAMRVFERAINADNGTAEYEGDWAVVERSVTQERLNMHGSSSTYSLQAAATDQAHGQATSQAYLNTVADAYSLSEEMASVSSDNDDMKAQADKATTRAVKMRQSMRQSNLRRNRASHEGEASDSGATSTTAVAGPGRGPDETMSSTDSQAAPSRRRRRRRQRRNKSRASGVQSATDNDSDAGSTTSSHSSSSRRSRSNRKQRSKSQRRSQK